MENVTVNEMRLILTLIKDFDTDYNANKLSKVLDLTSMGALKILKRLEKKGFLKSKQLGKAVFYKPNFADEYARSYFIFLLKKESEESIPRVKRWFNELKRLCDYAVIGILFGSVIKKESYDDVDFLVVLDQSHNKDVDRIVSELNKINVKHIHLVKQAVSDLKNNMIKGDKVILNAIKNGIIVFGYDKLIEVLSDVSIK